MGSTLIKEKVGKGIVGKRGVARGYDLIYYGHDTLKRVAEEISDIDGDIIGLIDSMYNVMYRSKGIGLAAPQVDVSKRLVILDIEEEGKSLSMELVNPVIRESSDMKGPYDEGCLSVPGISQDVVRPIEILVAGIDRDGKEVECEAKGLLARVIQHEIDHLNGVLFIDHLDDYLRNELRPELKKIKKLNRKA